MSFGSHARSLTQRSLARPLTANMLEKILLARSLLNVFEHFLRSLARSPRQLDYVKACSLASSYMYMYMLAHSLGNFFLFTPHLKSFFSRFPIFFYTPPSKFISPPKFFVPPPKKRVYFTPSKFLF